jgi:hypothetical protein
MFPPGGQAGETVEVVLGGYDWTPDMQVFVHDTGMKLELLGPPGPVIVPEPPYWFGKKARRGPFLLPRETKAKLTIPSDLKPGIYRWQVANANGVSATGRFSVGQHPHFVESDQRGKLVELTSLPVTVSGQIKHIEEVDRYRFKVEKPGPVTITSLARELNSPLNAVLEVRDDTGRMIADGVDTAGDDTALTFAAEADKGYTLSVYDLDFRGNRSFVYQVSIETGPRIVATIPAAGLKGETRSVEFVGYGLTADGTALESVKRDITFPATGEANFEYEFKTSAGEVASTTLGISEFAQLCESDGQPMALPLSVTGVLDERYGEDSYKLSGTKGDNWSIDLKAQRIGSPLDVALAVFDATGKELKRSDDVAGTTDAALEFPVPADGEYRIAVSDSSGRSGNRAAVYRLQVRKPAVGFSFTTPELLAAPIGKPKAMALKVTRTGGFTAPIRITVKGLPPAGVDVPADLLIPEKKSALSVTFAIPEGAAAIASLITIHGESVPVEGQPATEKIEFTSDPILLATTITPPFVVDAEGKDDVSKWPRGTTFPYPVLIERNEGFNGEIVLEMTSRQGRHRQGIRGPELNVPPGVARILYPIFLPEWLETTRTSRLSLNGVAKIADPNGNIRYSVVRQKTRMGFLPGGALLKLAAEENELVMQPGKPLVIPLTISRNANLNETALIELVPNEDGNAGFSAGPIIIKAEQSQFSYSVTPPSDQNKPWSERTVTIRATVMKDGHLPTVSQTSVIVLAP